ncbi:GNAT family N-acetyltransferase [Paenibacillus gorillae]|uniref:GNAT family N-acetyltransferase n=1 Tax=Paenibacillus gorillae TaxID=1243662 RepID=UPI0004B28E8A|nr:GNAT family N-acetyltransferase [Paenibacillus gorillae]
MVEGVNIEVSYEFLPDWWGNGYASEVIAMVLDYALNELHISKIIAETQTANIASCRLLEKVGMNLERTVQRYGAEQAIYAIEK